MKTLLAKLSEAFVASTFLRGVCSIATLIVMLVVAFRFDLVVIAVAQPDMSVVPKPVLERKLQEANKEFDGYLAAARDLPANTYSYVEYHAHMRQFYLKYGKYGLDHNKLSAFDGFVELCHQTDAHMIKISETGFEGRMAWFRYDQKRHEGTLRNSRLRDEIWGAANVGGFRPTISWGSALRAYLLSIPFILVMWLIGFMRRGGIRHCVGHELGGWRGLIAALFFWPFSSAFIFGELGLTVREAELRRHGDALRQLSRKEEKLLKQATSERWSLRQWSELLEVRYGAPRRSLAMALILTLVMLPLLAAARPISRSDQSSEFAAHISVCQALSDVDPSPPWTAGLPPGFEPEGEPPDDPGGPLLDLVVVPLSEGARRTIDHVPIFSRQSQLAVV